jgi:tetraacyldisaccharide 4'-kinase
MSKPHTFLAPFAQRIWQRKGLISTLLLPFSWLVLLAVLIKRHRHTHSAAHPTHGVPVIVVGNLMTGGTGKTPVVIALVNTLKALGRRPGIISRGYGVTLNRLEARVGKGTLDPALYGDEPALIAQATGAPVAVHPKRCLALQRLIETYPDVDIVVSDDGLQHLALARDIEIAVQDERGLGNERLLPAGPLREPPSRLKTVDLIVLHQSGPTPEEGSEPDTQGAAHPHATEVSRVRMRLQPVSCTQISTGEVQPWAQWAKRHRGESLGAVAAIGQPQRFFGLLRQHGLNPDPAIALPDHAADIASVVQQVKQPVVLVTDKDAVKLQGTPDTRVWSVQVAPRFSDPHWVQALLKRLQSNATPGQNE